MSNFVWCHGPSCHKSHTQDRIRGVKGSKVLRTRKVKQHEWNRDRFYSKFCSQGCYNDFANTHINAIIAIAPRTEALETPVSIERVESTTYGGHTYIETKIIAVDNNGG